MNIAENGYKGAIENGEHIFLVFYPLYPWFIRTLSIIIKDVRLCGIIISVISYGIGSVFFYKITKMELGDTADRKCIDSDRYFSLCIFLRFNSNRIVIFGNYNGFFLLPEET